MFTNTQKAIEKILYDRNLKSKVYEILQIIKYTDSRQIDYLKPQTLELHCVAVCYNKKTKKILIAKRNDQRETEPGKWEFGCSKASMEVGICESIVNDYKEDFDLDIEVVVDSKREDREPIPLAIYQIQKDNGLHKGIILLAVVDVDEINYFFNPSKKHTQIKWIEESEISGFSEDCVSDFKITLEMAFEKVRELGL